MSAETTEPTTTTTTSKEEKKKSRKKSKKKKRDPHKSRGIAYQMRIADDGVIWHSQVDIDRPFSPVVEWPEYPGFEIRDPMPRFSTTNPELLKQLAETGDLDKVDFDLKDKESIRPIEDPDKDDEDFDGVYQPDIPGLYTSQNQNNFDDWDPDPL